ALLGHQPGRRLVDQVAVLDGPYPLTNRAGDRLGGVGVGLGVPAEGLRLLDRRPDLRQRELPAVERIVGARHAARDHELDLVGALPAPPVSRTVVKPRSSIARMAAAPRAVISVRGIASRYRMFTSERNTWAWQSIRPGIRVRPPQSTTAALGAAIGRDDTSRMVSPST